MFDLMQLLTALGGQSALTPAAGGVPPMPLPEANPPGFITPAPAGIPGDPMGALGITPENAPPAFKALMQPGPNMAAAMPGNALGLETMNLLPGAGRSRGTNNPAADTAFMQASGAPADTYAGRPQPKPEGAHGVGDPSGSFMSKLFQPVDRTKDKDFSALGPLLKSGLLGGKERPAQAPAAAPIGRGVNAINPTIPALSSLPLPGVNLRERLAALIGAGNRGGL